MAETTYRVTSEEVEDILQFDSTIEDLTPFIAAAEQLVTRMCANAPAPANYSAAELKEIERWLAAHFIAIRSPRYLSESLGPQSHSIALQVGLNLGLTPYGQQAMLLDVFGGLAYIDKHVTQGKRGRPRITSLETKCPGDLYGQGFLFPNRWLWQGL